MFRKIGWTVLWTVASLIKGCPKQTDASPIEDDDNDFGVDNEPDCTGTLHRRHCRKFDREVAKELYWKAWDEVNESGSYLKAYGGFHVPQCIMLIQHPDGHLIEFSNMTQGLDKEAAYLGPLPSLPGSLCQGSAL